MPQVRILTDSSAYLPQVYADQYNIHVLPLTLTLEGQEYRDGVDIQASEFYELLIKANSMPKTSQVTVSAFTDKFRQLLDEGYEVLALLISSGLSGTRESALQALEGFPGAPIEIPETKLVSMALSFQVLAAARAAEQGASLAECKAVALDAYEKIGVYFTGSCSTRAGVWCKPGGWSLCVLTASSASRWSIFLGGRVSRLRWCLGIFIEMSSRMIQKG